MDKVQKINLFSFVNEFNPHDYIKQLDIAKFELDKILDLVPFSKDDKVQKASVKEELVGIISTISTQWSLMELIFNERRYEAEQSKSPFVKRLKQMASNRDAAVEGLIIASEAMNVINRSTEPENPAFITNLLANGRDEGLGDELFDFFWQIEEAMKFCALLLENVEIDTNSRGRPNDIISSDLVCSLYDFWFNYTGQKPRRQWSEIQHLELKGSETGPFVEFCKAVLKQIHQHTKPEVHPYIPNEQNIASAAGSFLRKKSAK